MQSDKRPANKDLVIVQKTTNTFQLQFLYKGSGEDISSFTVYFIVKTNFADADSAAQIYKKVTSHYDTAAGKSRIDLSATDTNITPGQYRYEISYTDADGNSEVVFNGRFLVRKALLQTRT